MFNKLITIQEQKIDSLQSQLVLINKSIKQAIQTISDLKSATGFEYSSSLAGSFLAISIHHKHIKQNIKLQEILINQKKQESIVTKKQLEIEHIQLEKYKHIMEEEKKARQERIKYKEALELDEFLQKA